jgi:hypothetical protein
MSLIPRSLTAHRLDTIVLTLTIAWILSIFFYNAYRRRLHPVSTLPYPPGPRPLPVIGNVLDMPKGLLWHGMEQWKKEYGDLVFVKIWNRNFLFVNTYEAAVELMEKKSAVYSSRGVSVMVNEL